MSPSAQVLYVHPAKQGADAHSERERAGNPYLMMPVGIVGMMNLLGAAGHAARGVNCPLEATLDPGFRLQSWLQDHQGVEFILVDLHWYEHAYGAIQVAKLCRACLPHAWIILGGLTASTFAEEILTSHPEIDFVIRGDAELPLLDLVEALAGKARGAPLDVGDIGNLAYRLEGQVQLAELTYCAGQRHLDTLNFVDLDWLAHADAYLQRQFSGLRPLRGHWLCIGRGCWHDCAYCGGGQAAHRVISGRQRAVVRSVERVLRDMERLAQRGVDQVAFNLDISELGEAFWCDLFAGMRDRDLRIGIYNECYNLPSAAFVEAFAQSANLRASRLALSPLSGSEAVRRLNGKRYSNEELLGRVGDLARHNVLLMIYFSLNLPGEGLETFPQTLHLAERLWESYPRGAIDLLNMCHSLDPVSPLTRSPERYGVSAEWATFADYYAYCRRTGRQGQGARCGDSRGYQAAGCDRQALEERADAWDQLARERGQGWHLVPTTW